uniref:TATA-binding protein-associated factor 172 n=1 Tax=Ciona intestinalis TaxID=7719 RepID=F6SWL4_CIOIN
LLSVLWNSLSEYDELTASTQSVLLLLSKLIKSLPLNIICQGFEPRVLVLRLLPFFHHVLTCVKEAALSTMLVVIEASEQNARDWMTSVSSDATWNLLQCCLLETKSNTRDLSSKVFISFVRSCPTEAISSCFPYIPMWLNLAYYPESVPIPPTMLVQHTGMSHNKNSDNLTEGHKKHIGGLASSSPSSDEHIMATRQCIACLIGAVCCHGNNNIEQPTQTTTNVENHLLLLMTSQSAFQRMVACIVVSQWWMESHLTGVGGLYGCSIFKILEETFYFSEISVQFIHVQTDMKAFLATLLNKKVDIENFPSKSSYSFHEVLDFCTTQVPSTLLNRDKVPFPFHTRINLREQRNLLMKLTDQALKVQFTLDSRVKAFAANAIVSAVHSSGQKDDNWKLPTKLNPIIRPLMESLKYEENVTVRNAVSSSVARLICLCRSRQPCPNPKLVKNLCVGMISFTARCPTDESVQKEFSDFETCSDLGQSWPITPRDGILTILRRISDLQTEINNRKRKRNIAEDETANYIPESDQVKILIKCAGAVTCIQTIIKMHEDNLLEVVPTVWEILSTLQGSIPLTRQCYIFHSDDISLLSQSLLLLETVVPVIKGKKLKEKIFGLVPGVLRNLWHEHTSIRYLCSRCVAVLTNHMPNTIMPVVVDKILPQLDNNQNITQHRGSIEALANIIEVMGTSVVPYAVLMVVPLLGCISDQDTQTRLLATQCFGQLVQYMPVESGIPDPPDLPEELIRQKQEDRRFLEQLFDNSSLDEYKIPVKINAKLRPYQEDGVKWLAFLNRYKLHGVLCDDMGLGKTLQTICILASDHFYQANKKQENEKFHSGKLISLVVCPPTLTGHWVAEVRQFCELLTPQHYAGNPTERLRLQGEVKKHNLVIASYEVIRNDIEFFSQIKWNYCVLDEGHAIKNGKSKLSQCIKSLYAKHRLILTGTPIQNSVLELWSLFDFLIPGLLGSESEFNARYSKPIIASRDAKSSSVEQEEGLIAMESLHRQVLPFMLRRMKEDVLKDLPPKIIQDYYCELSPLQFQLYEDFAKSRAKKDAESSIKIIDEEKDQTNLMKGTSHVFQALQYLQKVCNHPLFVLTPSHPQYNAIMTQLKKSKTSLHDVKHASKLTALQQLLLDCGIGKTGDSLSEESVANQHRALVFCQHRNLLNIIENDLLRQLMPGVTYLRLDGGVPSNQRYSIVSKFNNDPSIDLLLLTTKVGGLGLNLTGADTVIFVEHDWNPMVDLQAMDRAHRIGQKKVVNVYRIITRGTMEEKILGLQEFKLNVANTIVGDDNRGIQSMGTNQVLDLFNVDQSTPKSHPHSNDATNPSKGLRAMMEGLGELWDQNQYDEEYNLDNFLHSLTK